MKETDCRKCCVCAFKDGLCKEDFCEKYYREGSAEDFEKLLPHWINKLETDCISRQGVIDVLSQYPFEKVVNCISIIEEFPSAQTYKEEQIQKMQDLEQAQLEEAYRRGRESAQPKIGKWVYGSPVTVKCNQCGFYIPDWEAHSSRFCRNCGAKMEG